MGNTKVTRSVGSGMVCVWRVCVGVHVCMLGTRRGVCDCQDSGWVCGGGQEVWVQALRAKVGRLCVHIGHM